MGIHNKFVVAKEEWKMGTKIWQKNKGAILYKHQDKILNNYKGENKGRILGDVVGEVSLKAGIEPCPNCPREWDWLRNFECPEWIVRKLQTRAMNVQTIEQGLGDINLDRYVVRIYQFPLKNTRTEGSRYSMKEFFDCFRTHLNQFRDGADSSFSGGITSQDNEIWMSSNPLGAVCQFNGLLWLPDGFGMEVFNGDDASVVCSNYWDTATELGWIFSTLRTPYDFHHPVSGNRTFLIKKKVTGYENYCDLIIQGADRLGTGDDYIVNSMFTDLVFRKADGFWEDIVSGIIEFINDRGGLAEKRHPRHSKRYKYS